MFKSKNNLQKTTISKTVTRRTSHLHQRDIIIFFLVFSMTAGELTHPYKSLKKTLFNLISVNYISLHYDFVVLIYLLFYQEDFIVY